MKKINLQWFLSKGYKLTDGDVVTHFETNTQRVVGVNARKMSWNNPGHGDDVNTVDSFEWRNNEGVRPMEVNRHTPIEVKFADGETDFGLASEVDFNYQELIAATCSWRYNYKGLLKQQELEMNIDIAKEDGVTLKPVYTQEMSAKGELPPVGCTCEFSYADWKLNNGLEIGDTVKVVAHIVNNDVPVAVFTHETSGKHGDGIAVEIGGYTCFKPIDTRTLEQKQLDHVTQLVGSMSHLSAEEVGKAIISYLKK